MVFHSILFERIEDNSGKDTVDMPDFFPDLNLDQIVDAMTAGRDEYSLKPLFYTSLSRVGAIEYRHEIMQDLENTSVYRLVKSFSHKMHLMRGHLAQANKLYYKYQKESLFLDAVEMYCEAVGALVFDLVPVRLESHGFSEFREYLSTYARSERFTSLQAQTKKLKADLASVQYSLLIKGSCITVRRYEAEEDYSADVEATFEKFKQGAVKDYKAKFRTWLEMSHVETQVLEFVAQLYPEIFSELDDYCTRNSNYLDEAIGGFDREIQFYIAYMEFIAGLKRAGLKFCYPRVCDADKEVYDYESFDLALADKLRTEKSQVVCNDFYLKGNERILVISGPNQGGKTTFARAFGQAMYLANLGCPVPGREAQLFLFDTLFTHFEKEENIENLRGKLEDDLVRIHAILDRATPNSIIIMNEIFTSTTLEDAVFLSKRIMERIIQLDLLCVCVTFMDELASLSPKTVSMVSTVVPDNPASRTFKILRMPADGLAYALSIAEKYRLTYDCLKERIQP